MSSTRYAGFSCVQIEAERLSIEQRSEGLRRDLAKRANADAAKTGVGIALFLPTLLFLKGNGRKAAEFAQLKGEYDVLRARSSEAGCDQSFIDLARPDRVASAQGAITR